LRRLVASAVAGGRAKLLDRSMDALVDLRSRSIATPAAPVATPAAPVGAPAAPVGVPASGVGPGSPLGPALRAGVGGPNLAARRAVAVAVIVESAAAVRNESECSDEPDDHVHPSLHHVLLREASRG